MIIHTPVLGKVEVEPDNLFHFPDGLYGFEEASEYALITKQEDGAVLRWLQIVGKPAPCFVVFDPYEIVTGYAPELEPGDLRFLGAKDRSELIFFVIAVVPKDIAGITVNLKSPVAVSKKSRTAKQVILQNRDYPIKFPLFTGKEG